MSQLGDKFKDNYKFTKQDQSAMQNLPDAIEIVAGFPVRKISESGFVIIGDGEIGDKVRQLIEKTSQLRAIGFHTSKRTVLAESFFDGFFKGVQS